MTAKNDRPLSHPGNPRWPLWGMLVFTLAVFSGALATTSCSGDSADALLGGSGIFAATVESPSGKFRVTADDQRVAEEIALLADKYAELLWQRWFESEMPAWPEQLPITVTVGPSLGTGGAASFYFRDGVPYGWSMHIQGTLDGVKDDALTHEINHVLWVLYYGGPIPRWLDEGAATSVESRAERLKLAQICLTHLSTQRGIAYSDMIHMDYPKNRNGMIDNERMMALYGQAHLTVAYLISIGGEKKFAQFVEQIMADNGPPGSRYTRAFEAHYGFASVGDVQAGWLDWVVKTGCGDLGRPRIHSAPNEKRADTRPAAPPAPPPSSVGTTAGSAVAGSHQ